MSCKLIAISKPVGDHVCDTAEQLVAYCARVSNPKNQGNHMTGPKLINTLITEGHWSPLEMVNMTIEIRTTRDIARQILRHRSFSFQEFSQRYAEVDVSQFVTREARLQDRKNRQNSIEIDDEDLAEEWREAQLDVIDAAMNSYKWALEAGIAKEQARSVLPEGLTPSVLYVQGSLRSWFHYCMLRRGNGTQKEHIEIANEIWDIIGKEFPSIRAVVEEI